MRLRLAGRRALGFTPRRFTDEAIRLPLRAARSTATKGKPLRTSPSLRRKLISAAAVSAALLSVGTASVAALYAIIVHHVITLDQIPFFPRYERVQ